MIDLVALEAAVLDQIRTPLEEKGFRLEAFPGGTEDFFRVATRNQAFAGLRYCHLQPPMGTAPRSRVLQMMTYQFQVVYRSADLRSHQTALRAMPAIQDALTGFTPLPELQPHSLYLLEQGLVEVVAGLWMYSQMFELATTYLKAV